MPNSQRKNVQVVRHGLLFACLIGSACSLNGAESKELIFDRAKVHAQALEESLIPIRPGVPGKLPFWNERAISFIYAPAFDFKPVKGAAYYRFTVTSEGSRSWSFEDSNIKASLVPVWKDLPNGSLSIALMCQDVGGRWRNGRQGAILLVKKEGDVAPAMSFRLNKKIVAKNYRFTVSRAFVFEAEHPYAPLTQIWKDVPVGQVRLTVAGLDEKGGKVIALAVVGRKKKAVRRFERRVAFGGPYHAPAMDYIDAGTRWLNWQTTSHYKKWVKEGNPQRLGTYPCKVEVSAVDALTALSFLVSDSKRKNEVLQMARNAARTLIKGSFPSDWALAHVPPTYGDRRPEKAFTYGTVVMIYPARAGEVYLDLYGATKEKEFLDAAVRIADIYKKTQLPNGSWPILMEGKSGEKTSRSKTFAMPTEVLSFIGRLIRDHDLVGYQPIIEPGWKWIESNVLPKFRFEGQFEDTSAGEGGALWRLSHHTADKITKYLLQYRKDVPGSLLLAEEIMRWSEDQFLFWEVPPKGKSRFTPYGIEQHNGALTFTAKGYSTEASLFISTWQALYEVTGKEMYLAKAVTLANAMTVLQKTEYGGDFVATSWGRGNQGGSWPNCHTFGAKTLVGFGKMLKERKLLTVVAAEQK